MDTPVVCGCPFLKFQKHFNLYNFVFFFFTPDDSAEELESFQTDEVSVDIMSPSLTCSTLFFFISFEKKKYIKKKKKKRVEHQRFKKKRDNIIFIIHIFKKKRQKFKELLLWDPSEMTYIMTVWKSKTQKKTTSFPFLLRSFFCAFLHAICSAVFVQFPGIIYRRFLLPDQKEKEKQIINTSQMRVIIGTVQSILFQLVLLSEKKENTTFFFFFFF